MLGLIAGPSFLFLLVHREHALRDQEAAEDIHRRENEREEAEDARPDRAGFARFLGFFALAFASVNIFGGFLVTQRMLGMYKKKS